MLGRGREHPDGWAGYWHPNDFCLGEPWVRDCAPWNQFSRKWQCCNVDRKHRRWSWRRRGDIDKTLMQHDVRASREAAGTSSSAMGPSIQKETWLNRRLADSKTLHACQNTFRAAEDLTKEIVFSTVGEHRKRACCNARPSGIRLTHRKSGVTRHCQMLAGDSIVVARAGSTAKK